MTLNSYFDKVYVLNLHRRPKRMEMTDKRAKFVGLEYERFGATDGSVMEPIWKSFGNSHFKNPNYLGCAVSHLSIYRDALEKNYHRILILEDDNRMHRDLNTAFSSIINSVPEWSHLLYLGFIPLSDDCSRWDYSVLDGRYVTANVAKARNLWGLYAYGITQNLMRSTLLAYNNSFPMELDRYFVTEVQPKDMSYAIFPQLFAAEDGFSDNSWREETGMMQRSVHPGYANHADYI